MNSGGLSGSDGDRNGSDFHEHISEVARLQCITVVVSYISIHRIGE